MPWRTAILCLLVTMFEGFDLQILGVIAPMIRKDLSLTPQELGLVFGGATLGLMIGAIVSGLVADAIGRKPTLVASIAVFAAFTWVSSLAMSAEHLALARFCTGVGLGGAMPCIATLASEESGRGGNIAFVTIMFAGMPLGGGISALAVALWPGETSWRMIFQIGGALQIGLTALIWCFMPESKVFRSRIAAAKSGPLNPDRLSPDHVSPDRVSPALASSALARPAPSRTATIANSRDHSSASQGPDRLPIVHWAGVAALCIAFFCTLLSLHFFLNWLPSLLSAQGISQRGTSLVSAVFGLAGAFGSLFVGWLVQIGRTRIAMFAAYAGIAAASAAPWVFGAGIAGAYAISAVIGACLVGAQMTLYGLAPSVFPARIRGTGVGATIAMGRLGSFVGPTAAGVLLGAGWGQGQVMAMIAPVSVLAAISIAVALALVRPIDT